ncbi:hypothetical protein B0H67DRAFT_306659 [Lasiosphaeris hirsuta]|uniref:NACHT domain-containing protein n=1 Tax=Lasiosphaeris hirsuta TaxID=260670 RepID=A0AA40AA69_9PEZI|nr:hypothetical protein B0H67DRAFT_306659 [Lasiosphaeris hirsuta]
MDGLSVAASVIAVIQISTTLLSTCEQILSKIKSAEKSISTIISGIRALADTLNKIKDLPQGSDGFNDALRSLSVPAGKPPGSGDDSGERPGLEACRPILGECQALLRDTQDQLVPLYRRGFMVRLRWLRVSSEIGQSLKVINQHQASLSLALVTYHLKVTEIQAKSLARIKEDGERTKVLNWYITSDSKKNQDDSLDKHEPKTGMWVFNEAPFTSWRDTPGSLLWLHGLPGAGKTILSSTIIGHMQARVAGTSRMVVYYYFDFRDGEKQKAANFLKSVIYQLTSARPDLPHSAAALYRSKNNGIEEPSIEELCGVIQAEVERTELTYLIIDALHECPSSRQTECGSQNERRPLLQKFLNRDFLPCNLNILITSRAEPDIKVAMSDLATHTIAIQNLAVDTDVGIYVANEIERDLTTKNWDPKLKKRVIDTVMAGARGMFRLAAGQLSALKPCLTLNGVEEELNAHA